MAANKTVLDHLRLLECLKWNTDAAHPLTQKNLRKEASESEDTLDCLGDKKPFANDLLRLRLFVTVTPTRPTGTFIMTESKRI